MILNEAFVHGTMPSLGTGLTGYKAVEAPSLLELDLPVTTPLGINQV